MNDLILTVAVLLVVVGAWSAGYYRRKHHSTQRRADRLQEHDQLLTEQLRAAEICVDQLAETVIPAIVVGAKQGRQHDAGLVLPPQLVNTALADRLRALADQVADCLVQVEQHAQAGSAQQVSEARVEAHRQVAQARNESVDVARAAVRSFANSVVARAAKLSSQISAGVRRHVSDEAYATLVEIDHLAQQMLLIASGYAVLAGDKLSRRWPATTLSDIVRAAMGRIDGYERVQHPEMDTLAVESRAVEAVVHTLAVLLDNALRYSPPAASVYVSLEQGYNAAFLVVDDAGLRMEDERLTWARDIMSGARRDDITLLGAYPQTGLRVAALLADTYGFRVDLTAPNVYQGTRAVIVLPSALLTNLGTPQPIAVSLAPTRPAAQSNPERNPPAATTTASGLTVRRRTSRPAPSARALPDRSVEPGSPGVAAAWVQGTRRGRESSISPVSEGN
ncbi:ATP-binding protein [Streptomyces sp. Tue6028]|uniref:ATP-binding protein n=1 Tax=Streptomyces sp. Tue6028 TaxID=2036037 RepID=UPI003D71FA58